MREIIKQKTICLDLKNVTKIYRLYQKPFERIRESFSLSKKKYHKEFYALNDVSFQVNRGEVVGIVGKNGSGKSTILKIITGVLSKTSGTLSVQGKITAILELGSGFNPELTGMENLYLSGAIMNYSKEEMDTKISEIISFSEIGDFIDQPIKTYSSGMKARLGFSLAISVEPEILIVDEALSVGDIAFARKCYAKIEHLCKDNGTTVLFVSHSSGIIKQLCSRAIMLHHGKKILDGNAKNVVDLYDKFMGSKDTDINKIQNEFKNLNSVKVESKAISSIKKLDYFNPNIFSKSIVRYKENGASISNIKVTNLFDEEVNILAFNEEYIYSYKISFFNDYENVKVAMFLKNEKGIEISGKGVAIADQDIDTIKSGEEYHVKWRFKNILNEGFYFFNAAVNATSYGHKTILHRVIDAYMIKSVKDIDNNSKGLIDMGIELKIDKVNKIEFA